MTTRNRPPVAMLASPLRRGALLLLMTLILLPAVPGCGSPRIKPTKERPYPELISHDPAVQLRGIFRARTLRDWRAVGPLIDLLESDANWIRFSAYQALVVIVEEPPVPYDYLGPLQQRNEAISAWRRWHAERQSI